MASEGDHTVYGDEDLDEDDDDEESEEEEEDLTLLNHPPHDDDVDVDDDDVDVDVDDDSTSSSNLAVAPPPSSSVGEVTVAVPNPSIALGSLPVPNRPRIENVSIAAAVVEEKKPLDESRKLFQRLWTDEDEIELLQGFLDYTTQRGTNNSSHHHDTTAFYDQIKSRLQLDFNKNQLVEKLRRLKKKYRNVVSKIESGTKEYVFKSPHDQATFQISRKIWSGAAAVHGGGGLDDDEGNPNPNPSPNPPNLNDHNNNGIVEMNSSEKKVSRPRKRSRGVKEEKLTFNPPLYQSEIPVAAAATATASSIPNLVEETVRSCLLPLFKELVQNVMNGGCSSRGFGGVSLNPMPLSFGGSTNFTGRGGDVVDEKWRKQQILELEVYSKRLELVQDQIKSQLEELRSKGS